MICIIDYGVGNLFSLTSSFNAIGQEIVVSGDADVIKKADKLILPGVGAFGDASEKLISSGLDKVVIEQVKKGVPLMGVCLGMQIMGMTFDGKMIDIKNHKKNLEYAHEVKIKKNSRYYSYPHYTDVEIEHREVKGLSQSLRLSSCWNQDSNPDSANLGFHPHLSRPHHLLPTLQTSAVF